MPVIIGKFTFLKCDKPGCTKVSTKHRNQSTAIHEAERIGWLIDENTVSVTCPECRWETIWK
ncbi:MAG: hypothetical protein KAS32_02245 [Candidatus Peribacteraceae bacterium]|nr:hypothetical protein [Candidatus Peribacteraceae bacterium]